LYSYGDHGFDASGRYVRCTNTNNTEYASYFIETADSPFLSGFLAYVEQFTDFIIKLTINLILRFIALASSLITRILQGLGLTNISAETTSVLLPVMIAYVSYKTKRNTIQSTYVVVFALIGVIFVRIIINFLIVTIAHNGDQQTADDDHQSSTTQRTVSD